MKSLDALAPTTLPAFFKIERTLELGLDWRVNTRVMRLTPIGSGAAAVVANILANPLQLLAPLISSHVRMGGHIVLSGVLESQAAAVMAAYERWFTIDVWSSEEGWVALAGSRIDDDG